MKRVHLKVAQRATNIENVNLYNRKQYVFEREKTFNFSEQKKTSRFFYTTSIQKTYSLLSFILETIQPWPSFPNAYLNEYADRHVSIFFN